MNACGAFAVLLLAAASSAKAQSAGSVEIQSFGGFSRFDDTLQIREQAGGGASLAFFPLINVSVEAEGGYTSSRSQVTGNAVTTIPLRARIAYHVPLGGRSSSIQLGVGYVRNLYRSDAAYDDDGVTGVVGLRIGIGDVIGLRLNGTADYVRGPDGGRADNYVNWGGQIGLSFLLGNGSHRNLARGPEPHHAVARNIPDGPKDSLDTKPEIHVATSAPSVPPDAVGGQRPVLGRFNFRYGRGTLNPRIRAALLDLATNLIQHPEYRVMISGYTDAAGSQAANLRLSLARARTVETFLVGNGVPPLQLRSQGLGRNVPVASNRTAAGRRKNRRVELVWTN